MHIDHINIRSSKEQLEQVKKFYCNILNLKEGLKPGISNRGFWLYADDKPIIHLSERDKYTRTEPTGCFDHAAFQVTDLEEFINRLKRFGIEYQSGHIEAISMRQVFFSDPAGLRIELNCIDNR